MVENNQPGIKMLEIIHMQHLRVYVKNKYKLNDMRNEKEYKYKHIIANILSY